MSSDDYPAGMMDADQAQKVQTIVSITSVSAAEAAAALEQHGWNVEPAAHELLQDSRKRKAPSSFDPTPQTANRAKPKKKPKVKAAPKPKAADASKPAKKQAASKPAKVDASSAAGAPADGDGDAASREVDEKSHLVGEVLTAATPAWPCLRQNCRAANPAGAPCCAVESAAGSSAADGCGRRREAGQAGGARPDRQGGRDVCGLPDGGRVRVHPRGG